MSERVHHLVTHSGFLRVLKTFGMVCNNVVFYALPLILNLRCNVFIPKEPRAEPESNSTNKVTLWLSGIPEHQRGWGLKFGEGHLH